MELLYDEEQITVLVKGDHVNVAKLKRVMLQNSKAKALRNLETELTQAMVIIENIQLKDLIPNPGV